MLLVSCGGPRPTLQVKQFHLREAEVSDYRNEAEVVRAEKLKRLHGAVSAEERRARLGDYYSVRWNGPEGREHEPVRVVFDYRQAATASKVWSMGKDLPAGRTGSCEFVLNGEAYAKRGRVLAWRVRLYRGPDLVATRRSYLWQ